MTSALPVFLLLVIPNSLPSLLERGDQEFARMNYPAAEIIYVAALGTTADSAGLLWRLARVYVCMGEVATPDQKPDLYRRAEVFAQRSILADSMESEGHTWRAAALGNIAMFEGAKTKVSLCHVIKQELECSIRLNPEDDIAYSILGSFYRALGNVSWIERQLAAAFLGSLPEGGYDESERALRKAIALAPGVIRHHFELGELYMEQDRYREALEEFRQVLILPVLLASDERTQLSAAGLIKSISVE
ncbi:MAG: tetratricopeptide repeat protein [Bacteroidota bacterium]